VARLNASNVLLALFNKDSDSDHIGCQRVTEKLIVCWLSIGTASLKELSLQVVRQLHLDGFQAPKRLFVAHLGYP